jgi:SAM-dependent methyltransferase
VVGDSQALCFQDDSFDVIVARSLLHHLPDPKVAVDEMQRVLKSGGKVVFLDTNLSIISSIPRWVAYRGTRFSSEHRNLKFQELLRVLAERFEINQVEFFGYIAYPLLGFPDLIDFGSWFPFSRTLTSLLIKLDELIAKVPLVRSQSWGVIISASLPDETDSSGGAPSLLSPDLGA